MKAANVPIDAFFLSDAELRDHVEELRDILMEVAVKYITCFKDKKFSHHPYG